MLSPQRSLASPLPKPPVAPVPRRISTGDVRISPDVFKARLSTSVDHMLEQIQIIWKQAGYDDLECQSILGELLGRLKSTCEMEILAEEQILEHAKTQVQEKLREYSSYCVQLGRKPVTAAEGDGSGLGDNYADRLAELERLINSISGEVSQRSKLLNNEMSAIESLVSSLGEQMPSPSVFKGPEGTPELSDLRLQLMRQYKGELESKRDKRIEEMKKLAKECFDVMTELKIFDENPILSSPHEVTEGKPSTTHIDDDGNVVKVPIVRITSSFSSRASAALPSLLPDDYQKYSECDAAIHAFATTKNGTLAMGFHVNDLALLEERKQNLLTEKERRRQDLATTGFEIARMWTLLRIPTAERDAFTASFEMNLSLETLKKGHDEVARLQEIRVTSLCRVISSIRSDIMTLWDEAGIEDHAQRLQEFPTFFEPIEKLDDGSVEVHEAYFTSLKTRVDELRPILQKIARREAVVLERIELEHIQLNPERLTARGPNAREERKREEGITVRVKNLEKNTKDLMNQIAAWEAERGPFIFAGERYVDRVAQQEREYLEIRDSLRNTRKKNNEKKEPLGPAIKPLPGKKLPPAAMPSASTIGASSLHSSSSLANTSMSSSSTSVSSSREFKSTKELVLTEQLLRERHGHGEDQENVDRNSTGSDTTEMTSATEIRPRSSSATVRNH